MDIPLLLLGINTIVRSTWRFLSFFSVDLLKMCSSHQQGICNIQKGKSEVEKSPASRLKKTKLVGPLPHTQFPWARVTRRCLLSAAAWTGFVSLPNCGSVTVTVGINVDSCPSGCNQCGSRFDNIICRTLTYSMLTFSLAAETLHKPFS